MSFLIVLLYAVCVIAAIVVLFATAITDGHPEDLLADIRDTIFPKAECPRCGVKTRYRPWKKKQRGEEYINCKNCGCHGIRDVSWRIHGPTGFLDRVVSNWRDRYSDEPIHTLELQ
ncbi:MAG TPA: hypothetical protein VFT82_01825 [Candidatus Paceibacterota bacterium]|nr:hypothetical protein [Candidatus Paceibacterota bacterium]